MPASGPALRTDGCQVVSSAPCRSRVDLGQAVGGLAADVLERAAGEDRRAVRLTASAQTV